MNKVDRWFDIGDQYAFSYLYLSLVEPITVSSPRVFLISHAIEAYLKGTLVFKYPGKDPAKYSHRLFDIYIELKTDRQFLSQIEITRRVFDLFTISHEVQLEPLTTTDAIAIDKYYYLLICFKYGFDLKYFGAQMKSELGNQYGFGIANVDLKYAELIAALRKYINRDQTYHDVWRFAAEAKSFNDFSVEMRRFLEIIQA